MFHLRKLSDCLRNKINFILSLFANSDFGILTLVFA